MIDWLEVARRELSREPGEVSEVFTVREPGDPEKSGSPRTSDGRSPAAGERVLKGERPIVKRTAEQGVSAVFRVGRIRNPEKSGSLEMSASRSPADAFVSNESDLENPSASEPAPANTAERWVSDVFAVGAPKGLGVASGRESVGGTSTPPPPAFQIFDNPPDEVLRKPS
jgi:hypothetical protein